MTRRIRDDRVFLVYFAQVRGGGPIKIGVSTDAPSRIVGLQAWCPFPLDFLCMVEGDRLAERTVQDLLKDFRLHSEWFEPNAELDRIVAHAVATGDFPDDVSKEIRRRRNKIRAELKASEARAKKRPYNGRADYKPMSKETERLALEKRRAANARRLASRGHGRRYEFAVVATPLNASDEEANQ